MAYFPFMIQLNDKRVLVVGGGAVAARKARQMCEFGACVHVVAPEICGELLAMQAEHGVGAEDTARTDKTEQTANSVQTDAAVWFEKIERDVQTGGSAQTENTEPEECVVRTENAKPNYRIWIDRRAVCESDLDDTDVCIMATDEENLNSRYAALCRKRRILVNVVDVKKDCDFYFPAVIRQGEVVVSVSTGGSSPMLASRIKQDIRAQLRPDYGRIAEELRAVRETVLAEEPEEHVRREIFAQAVEDKMKHRTIRIGTRGSKLAMIQTDMVIDQLTRRYPDVTFEKVVVKTGGDRQQHRPISSFGGKSVFVDEIEDALLAGEIDLAVHSAKDMENPCRKGLVIAAALARGSAGDVLIRRKCPASAAGVSADSQACGEVQDSSRQEEHFTVGTGSLRRRCQLAQMYPNVTFTEMRGNVTTRIEKLRNGACDAVVLAAAGLERLSLTREEDLSYDYLSTDDMLPAAGQGVIAVEALADTYAAHMAQTITDPATETELLAERAVIRAMNAGCHEPIGVYAQLADGTLRIRMIYERDGSVRRYDVNGSAADYERLAAELAKNAEI